MSNYDPITLANAFIQAGELDDALDALNQHLQANPDDDDARRLRVQVLKHMGGDIHWHSALDDINALKVISPEDRVQQAKVLERMRKWEEAAEAMQAAWDSRQEDIRLADFAIEYWSRLGRWERVEQILYQLPDTWRWLSTRGDFELEHGGDADKALEYRNAALAHIESATDTTDDPWAANMKAQILLDRAETYLRLQALSEADADYAAAEQIIPNDPVIAFKRGLIAYRMGSLDHAILICQAAYSRAPAALRDEMQKALAEDARYAPIAAALDT